MKTLVFTLVFLSSMNAVLAQTKNYTHCNCIENLSDAGEYSLNCNGVVMEEGQYRDGKRMGSWITRNNRGTVIIKANYTDDKLDGTYDQYHYKGIPKLKAEFIDGHPHGAWSYYNEKGKIIKEGHFENGKPTGTWNIYDKKGKKILHAYNDQIPQTPTTVNSRYFKNSGSIARDDESGEWMILYFPFRDILSKVEPLGGYLLASDFFLDYLNIPYMFMNTYTHYQFIVSLEVNDGKTSVVDINIRDEKRRFNPHEPSFPFIVQTNSPGKLTKTTFSDQSLELLKNRIKDVVLLSSPWVSKNFEGTFEIQVPFVLNELKRY